MLVELVPPHSSPAHSWQKLNWRRTSRFLNAQTSGRRRNSSTEAARSGTSSFRTMEAMWTRTAVGEITSRSAISAVDRPCASRSITSHSRLVSRHCPYPAAHAASPPSGDDCGARTGQVRARRRTVTRNGKKTVEVVYLITSDRHARDPQRTLTLLQTS